MTACGRLTDEQIRSTFFLVPDFGIVLALGIEQTKQFLATRESIEREGGALHMIGWPDGMTVTMHIVDATQPIDLDDLVATYRAAAAVYRAAGMWGVV